eukprot:2206123-Amphidinium_carterae.1
MSALPKVILGHKYSFEIDVFGAGGVMFFMFAGTPPFPGKDKNKINKSFKPMGNRLLTYFQNLGKTYF